MKRTTTFLKQRMFGMVVALVATVMASSAFAQTKLTVLSGSKLDGSTESCLMLVDGKFITKWGQTFYKAYENRPWVVLKADQAVIPTTYFLVTGNDVAGANAVRNWSSWEIYGGNFESDEAATRDAETGWTLIDKKTQYPMPVTNTTPVQLTFSENPAETYAYYRIEVVETNGLNDGAYMEIGEFGLGAVEDQTETNYIPILSNKSGAEGGFMLIDGQEKTKWGFTTTSDVRPGWLIFKTTKAIQPTFYHLITGNDSGNNKGRGWKDYTIYGGDFASDQDATDDFQKHFNIDPTLRDFSESGWTVVEQRTGVGPDVIPDANYAHVYLDLLSPAAKAYSYFLIIVEGPQDPSVYCQMADFSWGTPEIFLNMRNTLYNQYNEYNRDQLAYKGLFDEYDAALAELNAVDNPAALLPATDKLDEIKSRVLDCVEAYKSYVAVVEGLIKDIANGKVEDAAGLALLKAYVEDEIAPNETYPAGTYKYILANRQLDVDAIKEETARLNADIETYVAPVDPINVEYFPIDGTAGFNAKEDYGSLIDGDDMTKWCHMHRDANGTAGTVGLSYIIFRTSEPIAPTFIRLFTSGDTGKNPGRNWKRWKVFAANFDSDDAATKDAEGWVVIDDQADAKMPAANNQAVFRYLSNPSETPYQYFKIEIYESAGQDRMQMSGLSLCNQGNFRQLREEYVAEFSVFFEGLSELVAEKTLLDAYEAKYKALSRCGTIDEMGVLYNELKALQTQLDESVLAYEQYLIAVDEYMYMVESIADPVELELQQKYLGEEPIAPGELFVNGSYQYIIQNGHLTTAQINKETKKVLSYVNAINFELPVVLDGAENHWSDGYYGQLVDGDINTKWGSIIQPEGMFLIFKMLAPANPFFYGLQTGGDTKSFPQRNWKDWDIYAANFAGDGEATRDAEGWVQIDHKENIGQDRLPAQNNITAYFGFTGEIPAEGYRYYKIELRAPYEATHNRMQMQELFFYTEEDFDEIRDLYLTELEELLSEDLVADAALIAQYEAYLEEVENAEDIEEMFVKYYKTKDFWKNVETSAQVYLRYMTAVADLRAYLDNAPLDDSEALETLKSYLDDEEEPAAEKFPNGSYNYIVENHQLTDSAVYAEIDYVAELKTAAVTQSYAPGADITAMLKNPTFAKNSDGWLGDSSIVQNTATYYDSARRYYYGIESVSTSFNIYQSFSGLKNGVYLFEVNGSFRAAGDYLSNNHAAKIYANENETYIQTGVEGYIPKDSAVDNVNIHITGTNPDKLYISEEGDTLGYILWCHNGAAFAGMANTYNNAIVANVTDGNLTVGITNPNTATPGAKDIERVILSNARLTYLGELGGELAAEGVEKAVANDIARANTLLAYEPSVGTDYASKPNFSDAEREALNTAIAAAEAAASVEEKYAVLSQFTGIFQSIYKTKFDYISLMDAELDVFELWGYEAQFMGDDELEKFVSYTTDVQTNWMEGTYTGEQALALADELYATYPDYLALNVEKYAGASEEQITQDAPFTYNITLDDMTRFGLAGFYDNLTEEETILTFEYKSNAAFAPSIIFSNPNPLNSNSIVLEDMGATDEWKRVYYNVEFARLGMFGGTAPTPWGNADHWLLWQATGNADAQETISIRNVQMITRDQMDAAGGTVGINGVTGEATLQQEGIYTLSGVRVNKADRGLYIIDGRKVVVK